MTHTLGPPPLIPSHNEELVAAAHRSMQLFPNVLSAKSRGLGQAGPGKSLATPLETGL
jgi:hypothetical protein